MLSAKRGVWECTVCQCEHRLYAWAGPLCIRALELGWDQVCSMCVHQHQFAAQGEGCAIGGGWRRVLYKAVQQSFAQRHGHGHGTHLSAGYGSFGPRTVAQDTAAPR